MLALALHGGSGHHVTGAKVAHHPSGGSALGVQAPRVAPKATAWAKTAVPAATRLTHTADAARPRIKPKAGSAAPARVKKQGTAAPAAAARAVRPLPGGTCGGGWGAVNAERDRILASGGPTDNAIQRNGAISAAYAQYYERNPGNEWAGLASIVSRQGRCAMQDARDSMGSVNYDYYYRELPEMAQHMPLAPSEPPTPGPVALGAMTAYDALAKTNKVIFSDIYPVLRFEENYGADALDRCGAGRPEGAVDPRVARAVGQMRSDDGDVRRRAGVQLANYEQRDIVQTQILNDRVTAQVFDTNQTLAGNAAGQWLGARKPEVALTAACNDGTPTVPFVGRFVNPDARVAYYAGELVPAFERLPTARLGGIIGQIAGGR